MNNFLRTLRTVIKNNRTAIIASFVTSALTVLILMALAGVYLAANGWPDWLAPVEALRGANQTGGAVTRDSATEESRVIQVAEQADPAVVSIVITKDVPIIERYHENDPFGDGFFNDFFGNGFDLRIPRQRQNGTEKREVGGGSGFFISADGLVVTNRRVVDDDKADYTILTNDGKKYDAEVLAKDTALDVAVLKVDGKNFKYLQFGNSDILKPGQTVIAIGNALAEFRNSVSVGVVSGLSRSITAGDAFGKSEQLEGVIQTDAAINPGNSGGPLLDIKGQVIGINVAVERGAENIGFALAANTVKSIVDSVQKHGEIVRPYLGVRYVQITESLKKKNNLIVDYGALIQRGETAEDLAIIPGSPADKAGLVENDIILAVDDVKLELGKSLAAIIRQKTVGQTIRLKIWHRGQEKEINVKLEKAPKE